MERRRVSTRRTEDWALASRTIGALRRAIRKAAGAAGLVPFLRPRRIDVCCCGISKTGTHSIAGLFENFRGGHHPDRDRMLELAIGYLENRLDDHRLETILRRRDRELWFEIESSSLSGIVIRPLAAACPTKRFIVTVRDVYGWFNSWVDHGINHAGGPRTRFDDLDELRLRPADYPLTKHDRPLESRGMKSLEAHFALWARHYVEVFDSVPPERLLVVRTDEILNSVDTIADFAGIDAARLKTDRGRLFVAPKKHNVLAELDPGYVEDVAQRHCRDLMQRYFPDVDPPGRT